jgi:hypothetical protein
MTWMLWIGAVLVVGGCGTLLRGRAPAAGALWSIAALAFVVVIWGSTGSTLPATFIAAVVLAFVVTLVLVALTVLPNQPHGTGTPSTPGRRSAEPRVVLPGQRWRWGWPRRRHISAPSGRH